MILFREWKTKLQTSRKYLQTTLFDKRLVHIICRVLKTQQYKSKHCIQMWAKDMMRNFTKDTQVSSKHEKKCLFNETTLCYLIPYAHTLLMVRDLKVYILSSVTPQCLYIVYVVVKKKMCVICPLVISLFHANRKNRIIYKKEIQTDISFDLFFLHPLNPLL